MSFWDERFAEPDLAYGDRPNDWLREVAARIPKGPVLCLAEGQGRNAVWLAEQGYEVTALDLSEVGLRRARELADRRGVAIDTIHADLATWEGPADHWAGIVAIFAHLPPPVRARVHGAVARWLRPGGAFVLEAYRPEQLANHGGGPRDLAMLYAADTLRDELSALAIEHLAAVDREVNEGRYHFGPAATVQVLAHRALAVRVDSA